MVVFFTYSVFVVYHEDMESPSKEVNNLFHFNLIIVYSGLELLLNLIVTNYYMAYLHTCLMNRGLNIYLDISDI